jgi:hypothetical protein
MAARLSALRDGRTLPPGFFIFKDSWYSFLLEAEDVHSIKVVSNIFKAWGFLDVNNNVWGPKIYKKLGSMWFRNLKIIITNEY